jgi:uncharacterized protein
LGLANKRGYAFRIGAEEFVSSPWKNGGGSTAEIAIFPEGSSLNAGDFLWRFSSARIEQPGPFSLFPGFDRLLVLLEGKELVLNSQDEMVALKKGEFFQFTGEESYSAALPKGPVVDLGLICRRSELRAQLLTLDFGLAPRSFSLRAATNLFFVAQGDFHFNTYPGDLSFRVKEGDAFVVNEVERAERLLMAEPAGKSGQILAFELN